ncbi:hypothetical protein SDJN02_20487 [Cucurbita argyrosperma subsp. argyrosperma]|nr:hypothetical protein SDJN02_20487 [Cucurbita argyrosperma subsp. argyrosperma]
MADADSSSPSAAVPAPLSAELNESRAELLNRIQSLKQDLQNWRSKLDTQVNTYRSELSELKKSLNVEVEHLRTEFQELRTTLQQQQEDVTTSLRNLGLQDVSVDNNETRHQHPAEISKKEDAGEATKEGSGSTEEKGNEAGN